MKKSELKEYIKGRIRKSIEEKTIVSFNTPKNQASNIARGEGVDTATVNSAIDQAIQTKKPVTIAGKLGEADVNELARPAEEFRISADFRDRASNVQTGGPVSPDKLNRILDILDTMLEDADTTTFPKIAQTFGVKQSRLYPTLSALKDVGALVQVNVPGEEEDEIEGGYEADEDGDFEGDAEVTDTETEDVPDFEAEPEPDVTSLEKAQTTLDPIAQIANTFTLDNSDLIQSVIKTYKNSKIRIAEIREDNSQDLSASDYKKALQQSKETSVQLLGKKLEELVTKIKQLEPEARDAVLNILAFKFKSVNANKLFDIVAKKLGKTINPMDAEENSDEEIIDMGDEEIMEDSGVEDIDHDSGSFKDYDSIYERMLKLVNYKG
jgi:phosphoribosylanthranilate isomerase